MCCYLFYKVVLACFMRKNVYIHELTECIVEFDSPVSIELKHSFHRNLSFMNLEPIYEHEPIEYISNKIKYK